jgi:phosphomannomutase
MLIPIDHNFLEMRNQTESELFAIVEQNTPETHKTPIFPQAEDRAFTFHLNKEQLEQLNLWEWFQNYKKEAQVSTAGIRGPQNILYPWDTRFPINQIGIVLATLGKSLVATENAGDRQIRKIAGCEVRYNSKKYVELIARIQAAQGIQTLVSKDFGTIPIWLVSFLIFVLDLDGGEHVTSSHSVSTKNATKDLNNQGSQYLPEESMQFVEKIEIVLTQAESTGYPIQFSAVDDANIDLDTLDELHDGVQLYVGYLRNGVATNANLNLIREVKPPIIVDCVGGCMYRTMRAIFERLGIADAIKWLHVTPDPLFHNIGKLDHNPKSGAKEYFDLSCDFSILDVVKTAEYETKLKNALIGTVIQVTDPDGDRLIVCQIEPTDRLDKLQALGIENVPLGEGCLLSIYTPNQSFLMTMDFHAKQLKAIGLWDNHPRFIIKTTPSAMAWDEWADANGVKVINVPVGFKEIAAIMKKVEKQLSVTPEQSVTIRDIYGAAITLGVQPRLVFAGEESGGMVTGPEHPIRSQAGRQAIAMREKSAGEAMVIVTVLAAHCKQAHIYLSDYLETLFAENPIVGKYDIREDVVYYNESEPDPAKLKAAKLEGEEKRDKNDLFYRGIAIAKQEGKITPEVARRIFADTFADLDFSNLEDVCFVGDGTYLKFSDKFVEIRKSGTDAKTKAYASGNDKANCLRFAKAFGEYSGNLTERYEQAIGSDYLRRVEEKARAIYDNFQADSA